MIDVKRDSKMTAGIDRCETLLISHWEIDKMGHCSSRKKVDPRKDEPIPREERGEREAFNKGSMESRHHHRVRFKIPAHNLK